MRGHLQCRDTLAGNEGCPLKTGTTVLLCSNIILANYITTVYKNTVKLQYTINNHIVSGESIINFTLLLTATI